MSRALMRCPLATLVLLLGACGADSGDGNGGASNAPQGALRCMAFEARPCPCQGRGMGTQTCSALGNSFGPCTGCPPAEGGTALPSAGAGAAGASGTSGPNPIAEAGAGAAGQAGAGPDAGAADAGVGADADTEPTPVAGAQPGISCGVGLPALCAIDTEKCCTRSLSVDTCIASEAACACELADCQVMEVHCDGPEDCPSGQVCCGTLSGGAAYQDFSCAAQCQATGNQRVACHQDEPECPASLVCANSQLLTNIQVCIDPATIEQ